MSWGIPPKIEHKVQVHSKDAEQQLSRCVKNALEFCGFLITDEGGYTIQAEKKMKMSLMSFVTFSRPKIKLLALLPDSGLVSLRSTYDYYSSTGIAMNDLGRQKKELTALGKEIERS